IARRPYYRRESKVGGSLRRSDTMRPAPFYPMRWLTVVGRTMLDTLVDTRHASKTMIVWVSAPPRSNADLGGGGGESGHSSPGREERQAASAWHAATGHRRPDRSLSSISGIGQTQGPGCCLCAKSVCRHVVPLISDRVSARPSLFADCLQAPGVD